MAKTDEAHLATVLSVDVTEVSDKALERVREVFATAVDQHNGTAAQSKPTGCGRSFWARLTLSHPLWRCWTQWTTGI